MTRVATDIKRQHFCGGDFVKTIAPVLFLSLALPTCGATIQAPVQDPLPAAATPPSLPVPAKLPRQVAIDAKKSAPGAERILWANAEQTEARFLPEGYVAALPLSELPISPRSKERLRWHIEDEPTMPGINASGTRPDCLRSLADEHPDPASYALDFLGLVRKREVALVGEIVRKEVGWDGVYEEVTTRVDVLVLEVLRDVPQQLQVGEIVSYLEQGGFMVLRNLKICTFDTSRISRFPLKERVLVLGTPIAPEKQFLQTAGLVFSIVADEVQPRDHPHLNPRVSVALETLRRALENPEAAKP